MSSLKLAFGHKARVGKDTACEYICKTYGGNNAKVLRFAKPVYEIAGQVQRYLEKDVVKDASLLQLIGLGMRQIYGENIWVDRVQKDIRESESVDVLCVPDMRFTNEMEMLRNEGFTCIDIVRNSRVIDRDPNHPSEIGLDGADFSHVINNDATVDQFYSELDYIVAQVNPALYEKIWGLKADCASSTSTLGLH